jgi:hypothetical protein
MDFIMSILATYPGAIILILFGSFLIHYTYKEFKKKRETGKNYDIMGVEIQGYASGGFAIVLGFIILYLLIFTNVYD